MSLCEVKAQLEMTGSSLQAHIRPRGGRSVSPVAHPAAVPNHFAMNDVDRYAVISGEGDGTPVTFMVSAPADSFDQFYADALQLLGTLTFP